MNKKKQKNFLCWDMGVGTATAHGPALQKFFGSRVPMMGGKADHLNRAPQSIISKKNDFLTWLDASSPPGYTAPSLGYTMPWWRNW